MRHLGIVAVLGLSLALAACSGDPANPTTRAVTPAAAGPTSITSAPSGSGAWTTGGSAPAVVSTPLPTLPPPPTAGTTTAPPAPATTAPAPAVKDSGAGAG